MPSNECWSIAREMLKTLNFNRYFFRTPQFFPGMEQNRRVNRIYIEDSASAKKMINCRELSDEELISALKELVKRARFNLIGLLRHLAEFDRRSLAGKSGFSSLFAYCTQELRCSEGEAARRIHAARAAERFPVLYRSLGTGRLSLTAVSLLAPHLTKENWRTLLKQTIGKSTREIEAILAEFAPGQIRRDCIRYAGTVSRSLQGLTSASSQEAIQESGAKAISSLIQAQETSGAITTRLIHVSFTADEKLLQDISRAKELLRHKYPRASLEEVFGRALDALLDQIDPDRRQKRRSFSASTDALRADDRPPRMPKLRRIPRRLKDEVWHRDHGSCAFVSSNGRRCLERGGLEYDHILPWAKGGRSDDASNIRLLCRAHNQLEARRIFGDELIQAALLKQRSKEGRRQDRGSTLGESP